MIFSDIFFSPSLDINDEDGLYDTLREMMKDMFLQATLFLRIDPIIPIPSYEGKYLYLLTFFPTLLKYCKNLCKGKKNSFFKRFILSLIDDISNEDAMIDLYQEILKRVENSINDIVQYASV